MALSPVARAALVAAVLVCAGGCDRCGNTRPGAGAPPTATGATATLDPLAQVRLADVPVDWSRPLPATPPGGVSEAGYVGSEACKDCHKDVATSYARHSMARTGPRPLERLDPKWLARIFDVGATQPPVLHERSRLSYRPVRKGTEYFVEEFVDAPEGGRVHSWMQKLDLAFSAGSYGMAFYFRQGGRLYQAPIDYYPKAERWGLDPGASEGNPRFSKPLRSYCISCHADYPHRRPGLDDAFVEPIADGVGCERCHGPGAKHAASLRAADIVNPARLPPPRQLDVCVQCHESSHSQLRAERGEFSYRPGEPLSAYRVNYVGDPPEPDRFDLLAHPDRMVRSACWQKSNGALQCASCHDPHKSSFDQPASWWDAKCDACHKERPCTETAGARAAQGGHCVTCHMRSGPPWSPTLVTITDHWIQRRPPPIRPGVSQPQHLVAWPDLVGDPAPGPDLAAVEAMAYASAGLNTAAEKLLPSAVGPSPHVPRLYEWLVGRFTAAGQPAMAARAAAGLLSFEPDDRDALVRYARLRLDRGAAGVPDAMRALDRALAIDPDAPDALETKGIFLFRSGRLDEARPLFEHAARVGPSSGASHVALAVYLHRDGREADALAELEVARRIDPDDAWILQQLEAGHRAAGDRTRAEEAARARTYFAANGGRSSTSASGWLPQGMR